MFEAWLLDTNILLRMSNRDDPYQSSIDRVLRFLVARGARLCVTSQILGEFWNVSTRPRERNGLGLSILDTLELIERIERDFELLPDSRAVRDRWRTLLVLHQVQGAQVHDARLAASMYVHGIDRILTINVRDLKRFPGLRAVSPSEWVRDVDQP